MPRISWGIIFKRFFSKSFENFANEEKIATAVYKVLIEHRSDPYVAVYVYDQEQLTVLVRCC